MTFATTYNLPLGVCVSCGGKIIGRRPNAIYCAECVTGHQHLQHNVRLKNISVSVTYDEFDFLEFLRHNIYPTRSEAVRALIDYRIESFRRPIDPIQYQPVVLTREART
jgi:hypothetical protein